MKSQKFNSLSNLFDAKNPWGYIFATTISTQLAEIVKNPIIALITASLTALVFWVIQSRLKASPAYIIKDPVSPIPKEGLILMVSPYNRTDDKQLEKIIETNISDTSKMEEMFRSVSLDQSNLKPQIEAIKYHRRDSTLKEIWLISSKTNSEEKGSETTAAFLEKYIQFTYGMNTIKVHREGFAVDTLKWEELCQKVEHIFRTASLKGERIVADITGGKKIMTMALCVACIQPGRRMQYMESTRDDRGNPTGGKLVPILADIDPYIYRD